MRRRKQQWTAMECPKKITSIDILEQFPKQCYSVVEEIDFSEGKLKQLSHLPKIVWNLPNIKRVNLDFNNFQRIPTNVLHLTNLEELSMRYNNMQTIAPKIEKLSKLRVLDLNNNHIVQIPKEIGNLSNLFALRVEDNLLTSLPDELEKLHNLTVLEVNHNPLQYLSRNVCAFLQKKKQSRAYFNVDIDYATLCRGN